MFTIDALDTLYSIILTHVLYCITLAMNYHNVIQRSVQYCIALIFNYIVFDAALYCINFFINLNYIYI